MGRMAGYQDPCQEKLVGHAEFDGPVQDRKCHDIFFTLMLLLCWTATTVLGLCAMGLFEHEQIPITEGDPWRLIRGIDNEGHICGSDPEVKGLPKLYYPNAADGDEIPDSNGVLVDRGFAICVDECPNREFFNLTDCQDWTEGYEAGKSPWTDDGPDGDDYDSDDIPIAGVVCNPTVPDQCWCGYTTYSILDYCVELDVVTNADGTTSGAGAAGEEDDFTAHAMADLWTTKYHIAIAGFPVAMAVSFIYLRVLRFECTLRLMVWFSVFSVLGIFAGAGYLMQLEADEQELLHPMEMTEDQIFYLRVFGYVCWGLAAAWFFVICWLRKRIGLAIGIIKETSRAVSQMPALAFFPLLQLLGVVIFSCAWLVYSSYLASAGEIKVVPVDPEVVLACEAQTDDPDDCPEHYKELDIDTNTRYALLYMFFAYYWTTEFICAFGQIVIAMCVSKWYFTRGNFKSDIDSSQVGKSIKTTLRYHVGTAAYGSLIIAIIKCIRAGLLAAKKKCEASGNKVASVVLCCLSCCMWCVEKLLKFVNKNAYIQTAIFGYGFCTGAKKAFFLILRNVGRILAVTVVGGFVMFIAKVFITCVTAGLGYYYLSEISDLELYGYVVPSLMIGIFAFFTATLFCEVFNMAVDTILQCFVADEEMFGVDGNVFAEESLRTWIEMNGAMMPSKHPTADHL